MTKLHSGVHSLRIQTGKYENSGAPIPFEQRKFLVCKKNYIEDELHFFMYRKRKDDNREQQYRDQKVPGYPSDIPEKRAGLAVQVVKA